MARETKIAKVFPGEPTNLESVAGKWRVIKEGESGEANIGNEHLDSTGTPTTTRGLTITTAGGKGQKTEMLFQVGGSFGWPTLAAGECVKKVVLWVRNKDSTVAIGLKFGFVGFGEVISVESSEAKWRKIEVPSSELWRFGTAARREAIKVFLEDGGTITSSVYEVYIELTSETETSRRYRGIQEGNAAAAKAESNAEKKATVTATNEYANVGDCALITVIANQEAAPTEITDGLGNTYHRDASENDANGHNVSVWSAAISTTGKPVYVITVGAEKVKICLQADEFSPFVAGGEGGIQATATAHGEGTTVSGANVATRASKGDLTIAAAIETTSGSEEPAVKSPMEAVGSPLKFGEAPIISGAEGVTTPAIGAEVKPEFTLSKSNKWGTVTVDYKVLTGGVEIPLVAASAASSASLALRAQTPVPLNEGTSASAASLALNAATAVPLTTAQASSASTLALAAATQIPLTAGAAGSSASLAITAPTTVPVAAASVLSSASLALTAPTQIPLISAAGAGSASLSVRAPTQVNLSTAIASSNAGLTLTAPTQVPLDVASAVSSTSLALRATAQVTLEPASASSSASLTMRAPTQVPLETASSNSSTSIEIHVVVKIEIPLQAALALGSTTLALTAPTLVPLSAASSTSSAECHVFFREVPIGVYAAIQTPQPLGVVVQVPPELSVSVNVIEI